MFAEAESGVTCPQGRGHRLPGRHLVSGGVSWDRPSCLPSARRLPQARGSPPCTPSPDSPPASPPRPAQRPPPRGDAGRLCRAHRPGRPRFHLVPLPLSFFFPFWWKEETSFFLSSPFLGDCHHLGPSKAVCRRPLSTPAWPRPGPFASAPSMASSKGRSACLSAPLACWHRRACGHRSVSLCAGLAFCGLVTRPQRTGRQLGPRPRPPPHTRSQVPAARRPSFCLVL